MMLGLMMLGLHDNGMTPGRTMLGFGMGRPAPIVQPESMNASGMRKDSVRLPRRFVKTQAGVPWEHCQHPGR
jgi:hypothetical protein